MRRKKAELDRCAATHGRLPADTRVVVIVGPDGRAKTIGLQPTNVAATALGACIKAVFQATTFPRGAGDHEITINLNAPV
ncbi:MAG: hypothetical protein H7138_08380 [Myxococcales bacterium]|nr:hypothetical protein [Myxococcales bacterium]